MRRGISRAFQQMPAMSSALLPTAPMTPVTAKGGLRKGVGLPILVVAPDRRGFR